MVYSHFSDYGSGSSINSSTLRGSPEEQTSFSQLRDTTHVQQTQKAMSLIDLGSGKRPLDDVMRDFKSNGFDSPYDPEKEEATSLYMRGEHRALDSANTYLRQISWPAPERSPTTPLPRPLPQYAPPQPPAPATATVDFTFTAQADKAPPGYLNSGFVPVESDVITPEQLRVINSIPSNVLQALLRDLQRGRNASRGFKWAAEFLCRFCKNNGERESYYRSHELRDVHGRVMCPVLRAFVCARCGASGDSAHTIKYCPRASHDERMKSAAMMRSVRMASGRRRSAALLPPAAAAAAAAAAGEYVVFGDATPSVIYDNNVYKSVVDNMPLDPMWAALEQKLMM